MLKSLAAGAALWEPACGAPPAETAAQRAHPIAEPHPLENPIRIENRLLGTDGFALSRPALAREVEGFASAASAIAGETVDLCVSVNRAQGVRWDLYRIGYYQGHGARLISSGATVQVSPQPLPRPDPRTGLLECAWETSFSVPIDPTWVTGYYLFKLSNDDGFESYIPLVIREFGRQAPLLVQASVTTWQAYNLWGGVNLYVNHAPDPSPFSGPRGFRVSFDRPYASDADIGAVEHAMVRWLEQQGYDAAYVTNIDVDSTPEILQERSLFMSVGHDEYWTLAERDSIQGMRDSGLCLAFFSGNTAYRRIRLDPSSSEIPRRIITCYKSGRLDPHRNAPDTTSDFQEQPHPRPENELVGVLWAGWARLEGYPFVVTQPDHWIYQGTGVQAGDTLGQIVGYEWDVVSYNSVSPPGLEVVAESPALHEYGYCSIAHATVYYPTQKSFVFAAGTVGWANGLGDADIMDAKVQRVTQNILLRAGLHPEARSVVPTAKPQGDPSSTRTVVLAGTGSPGNEDGPVLSAQFRYPAGVAAGLSGELYVCDTGNHQVRKLSLDGQITTLAGSRAPGTPHLSSPTGIVVDSAGTVFVTDTGNHRILSIAVDGSVQVYAGRAHSGSADSSVRTEARFYFPRGLALDASGALYVADLRNDAIRRIDDDGVVTVVSAAGGPTAVALAADGTLYYLATSLGSIIEVSPTGVRRVLANVSQKFGNRNGPGAHATLRAADGLVLTARGLLFSDTGNNSLRTLAFDEQNTVAPLLSSATSSTPGFQAGLNLPRGLCSARGGYAIADAANHRILHFSAERARFPL